MSLSVFPGARDIRLMTFIVLRRLLFVCFPAYGFGIVCPRLKAAV